MLQHPVSDEHLKHIGDMTVSFAMLEGQIVFFAGMLCENCQEVVQIAAAQLSFKNFRAFLTSLYIERFGEDDDFPTLRELTQRAESLENMRNRITHSQWAYSGENTIKRFKHTAREKHGLKFQAEDFTVDDLAAFVKKIKILASDILDFWTSLAGKPFSCSG